MLGELKVKVENAVARTMDGALAGSTTTLTACIKNMVETVGASLEHAVYMATAAPAKAMGLFDTMGSLDVGKVADIIAVDDDYNVKFVMVEGVVKLDNR
jgi:N-acetylglucosamine-6-phosphate deacetylase